MCCVISITRFCLEIFSQCNYTDLQGWLKRSTCATRAVPYTGTVNDAVKSQGRICTVVSGNHEFFFPTLLLLVFMFVSLSVGLAAMPLLLHVSSPQRGPHCLVSGNANTYSSVRFSRCPVLVVHNRLSSGVKIVFNVE